MNHYHLDIGYLKFKVGYFISFLLLTLSSFSQEDTAIVRTYGGPYYEEGRQIIESINGGYAIIGTTGSDQQNNTNFYLLRLDEELNCMWSKSLGGSEVEWGYSMVEDAGGNFLLCGYTNSYGAGAYDALVYKVDAEGEVIWQQTFGGIDWDFAYKIIEHPEAGYLLCGKTYSMGNGGSDGYLLHIDSEGNLISEWTYGGEGDDEFVDVEINDSQIILTGSSNLTGDITVSGLIVSIGFDGLIGWTKTYSNDLSIKLMESLLENQQIICSGYLTNEDDQMQSILLSIDVQNGFENWFFEVDQPGDYVFNNLVIENSSIYLCGFTNAFGDGSDNGLLAEFDLFGNYLNSITIGADQLEFTHCIVTGNKFMAINFSSYLLNGPSTQLGVFVYPDLTFSASSQTNWTEEGCFSTRIETTVTPSEFAFVAFYDLLGRLLLSKPKSEYLLNPDMNLSGSYLQVFLDDKYQMISTSLVNQ